MRNIGVLVFANLSLIGCGPACTCLTRITGQLPEDVVLQANLRALEKFEENPERIEELCALAGDLGGVLVIGVGSMPSNDDDIVTDHIVDDSFSPKVVKDVKPPAPGASEQRNPLFSWPYTGERGPQMQDRRPPPNYQRHQREHEFA